MGLNPKGVEFLCLQPLCSRPLSKQELKEHISKNQNQKLHQKSKQTAKRPIILNVNQYTDQFRKYQKKREISIRKLIKNRQNEAQSFGKERKEIRQDRWPAETIDWSNLDMECQQGGAELYELLQIRPSDRNFPAGPFRLDWVDPPEKPTSVLPTKPVTTQVVEYANRIWGPLTEKSLTELALGVKRDPRLRKPAMESAQNARSRQEASSRTPNTADIHPDTTASSSILRNSRSPEIKSQSHENAHRNWSDLSNRPTPMVINIPSWSIPICPTGYQVSECNELLGTYRGSLKILCEKMMDIFNSPLDTYAAPAMIEKYSGKFYFLRKLLESFGRNHMDMDIVIIVYEMNTETTLYSYFAEVGYLCQRISSVADNWRKEYGVFVSSRRRPTGGQQTNFSLKADLLIAFDSHILPNDIVFSQIQCSRKLWLTTLGSVEERLRKYVVSKSIEHRNWNKFWYSDATCGQILVEPNNWPTPSISDRIVKQAVDTVTSWIKSPEQTEHTYRFESQELDGTKGDGSYGKPASALLFGKKRHAYPSTVMEVPLPEKAETSKLPQNKRARVVSTEISCSTVEEDNDFSRNDELPGSDMDAQPIEDMTVLQEQNVHATKENIQAMRNELIADHASEVIKPKENESLPLPQAKNNIEVSVPPAYSKDANTERISNKILSGPETSLRNENKRRNRARRRIKEAFKIPPLIYPTASHSRACTENGNTTTNECSTTVNKHLSSDEEFLSASDTETDLSQRADNPTITFTHFDSANNDDWSQQMQSTLDDLKERYSRECEIVMEKVRKKYEEEMDVIRKRYQVEALKAFYL
ncbi:hypothetical protein EC973_002618 [Apophysomyces ossiformis]|uniref:Uncharacterized protein n=1 Tax=Apophysomyces ossiformis TaxID=679940 RepID=A0A8H7BI72_9FUNG|nr:hypothetical protein EC973_002618 [Apophysomyces ossiformis]